MLTRCSLIFTNAPLTTQQPHTDLWTHSLLLLSLSVHIPLIMPAFTYQLIYLHDDSPSVNSSISRYKILYLIPACCITVHNNLSTSPDPNIVYDLRNTLPSLLNPHLHIRTFNPPAPQAEQWILSDVQSLKAKLQSQLQCWKQPCTPQYLEIYKSPLLVLAITWQNQNIFQSQIFIFALESSNMSSSFLTITPKFHICHFRNSCSHQFW